MLFDDIALVRAYRALNRSQRRLVRAVAQAALLTLVLLWLAPFLSIAAPGALWSRDSLAAVLACVTRLPEALSVVREERARTAAEKDAFERFADRVRRMEAADPPEQTTTVVGAGTVAREQPSSGADVAAVREAYRETVMGTDHYEEEYGESLATNVATEFGPDYVTALAGAESLTPPLQRALVEASHRAARERASFLHTLDRELDALVDARRRLRRVAETTAELRETPFERRSLDEVVDAEGRVESLETECEAVEERRATLRDQPERDGTDLREYLYGGREWRYPVVGDALDCLASVRAAQRRLVKAVLRRP